MKPKVITLAEGERIVAVVCENASGPGWAKTFRPTIFRKVTLM